jgi:4-amino-4-deoxy-L-arabinose transferase-like glycosyltransferase
MPVFGFLDTLPIRIWDEARLAINAYEMFNNNNFIVTYFMGEPDMWNTKPPLLIWTQVFFMKIIGVNELAIRLPSAFSAFFTCIALLIFSTKYLKTPWIGLLAAFVLITSNGYIEIHASRTGDYDTMLTLFTTLSGLLFFSYCETKNTKHLYLFFLFTAMAVLTKSVTGLMFLPAILLYSVIQKQLLPLFKNKHFYLGVLSFLVLVVGYYVLRETYNPGYISAVYDNELGGRYLEVNDGHNQGFWFYYDNFINYQLSLWFLLIPIGLVIGFVINNKKINRLTLFTSLMVFTFFMAISTAKTKLDWYNVSLYPYLAIIIAISLNFFIFELLNNFKQTNRLITKNVTLIILLIIIGITPYQKIIEKTYKPKEHGWKDFYEISYYLKDAVKGKHHLDNQYVLYDGYNAHNLFYVNILNDKGIKISFKDWAKLEPTDVSITQQAHIKQYVEKHYENEIININGSIVTYKIHGRNDKK